MKNMMMTATIPIPMTEKQNKTTKNIYKNFIFIATKGMHFDTIGSSIENVTGQISAIMSRTQ